jgi:hypothetical protein
VAPPDVGREDELRLLGLAAESAVLEGRLDARQVAAHESIAAIEDQAVLIPRDRKLQATGRPDRFNHLLLLFPFQEREEVCQRVDVVVLPQPKFGLGLRQGRRWNA